MLKSPVLSVPVQRALAGTTATGGAMQSGDIHGWLGWQASEGADQASRIFQGQPSEGADQASRIFQGQPSEGADQASRIFQGQPSEGADQSTQYGFTNLNGQPSEGADQSYIDRPYTYYMASEGADQSYMDGHVSHYIVSEGADQASRIFQGQPSEG